MWASIDRKHLTRYSVFGAGVQRTLHACHLCLALAPQSSHEAPEEFRGRPARGIFCGNANMLLRPQLHLRPVPEGAPCFTGHPHRGTRARCQVCAWLATMSSAECTPRPSLPLPTSQPGWSTEVPYLGTCPNAQLPRVVHTGKTSIRRSAMEIQRQQADEVQQADDSKAARIDSVAKPASFRTFEEAVDASGLLAERPPVQPGESGTNTYLVQPTQLLSWYPRRALPDGTS